MYVMLVPVFMFLIIGIHEMSRYYAASILGIKKIRVSIGMGIPLLKIIRKDSEVSIRLFPISGHTKCGKREVIVFLILQTMYLIINSLPLPFGDARRLIKCTIDHIYTKLNK